MKLRETLHSRSARKLKRAFRQSQEPPEHEPSPSRAEPVVVHDDQGERTLYVCVSCRLAQAVDQFTLSKSKCRECMKAAQNRRLSGVRGAVLFRLNCSRRHMEAVKSAIDSGNRVGEAGHTVTFEQLLGKLADQKGRCAYSGVRLRFGLNAEYTASIERIDSQKGYHLDNIVWIAREWNVGEKSAGRRRTEEDQARAVDHDGLNRQKVQFIISSLRVKLNKPVLTPTSACDTAPTELFSALSL